eukprot:TRINITY_DN5343_c0_g1_i1.p1 TRINITY_DN5343_c0_g1~~TRINITY_DN5343_c0_g1_i1.p1  ORF type:complete len:394 (+),score=84.94 TRINITY_DN5343_c0_g1_i1:97-1182(+)
MMEEMTRQDEQKPYRLTIRVTTGGREASIPCVSSDELWATAKKERVYSMYRGQILGVVEQSKPDIIPIDAPLDPGIYLLITETMALNEEDFEEIVELAIDALKANRPPAEEIVRKLETELSIIFTHSSLVQEGSTISLRETQALAAIVAQNPMHKYSEEEMRELVGTTTSEDWEVLEAVNHLKIVREILPDLIRNTTQITEELVLGLHRQLMDRLLRSESEGLPGEYRKIPIVVEGSTTSRPDAKEIPGLMKEWYDQLARGPNELESFFNYLTRIHTQFQHIHPFRDGNGRIGRLVMNILSLQRGWPILFFDPNHKVLFSQAIEEAHHGRYSMFNRMILEAIHLSLQSYSKALGIPLIKDD